jgi:hypothetical protein
MGLIDKLKDVLLGADLPEETREVFETASSAREIVKGLEVQLGKNELDLRENEEHLITIEKSLLKEEVQLRKGGLTPTQETILLRRIERLEKQRGILENLVTIYNEKVNLHLNLISKIQQMEAMRANNVKEELVDNVVEDVGEHLAEFRRVRLAGADGERQTRLKERDEEQQRLQAIKKRVLSATATENSASTQKKREQIDVE